MDIPKEAKQPIIQPLEEARHGWRVVQRLVLARCWRGLADVERVQSFDGVVAKAVERHKGGPGGKKQKVGNARLDRVGASAT